MTGLPPEYLIVVCEFTYDPRGKNRYIPSEVRRFLAGKKHQLYGRKKREGLPEKITNKFGPEILIPLHFSLIKYPVKIEGRLFNAAVGAIMIYRLAIVDRETFKQVYNDICEELRKRFKKFEIIVGYGVNDEC